MRNKVQENEQPLAYAQCQQNVPMEYTASAYAAAAPATKEPMEAYPAHQQSAIQAPEQYSASEYAVPVSFANEPAKAYPDPQESYLQAPESAGQYKAPATANVDPIQTNTAPSPVKTTVETPIQTSPISYYR
ncbi:hypothetical protein QYM36_000273 [Artemia franciscana]|uniref:Uncharacterized protein n=1 Tax=Artemia franciscana TaxID=6661 RepID=A0AA88IAN0_ARTSF|nr:hypothetical protein QYM36_000273 [Artemia franciscana]